MAFRAIAYPLVYLTLSQILASLWAFSGDVLVIVRHIFIDVLVIVRHSFVDVLVIVRHSFIDVLVIVRHSFIYMLGMVCSSSMSLLISLTMVGLP